jgi:hypothetical protein
MIHEDRGMDDVEMLGQQLYQILSYVEDGYLAPGAGTQPF